MNLLGYASDQSVRLIGGGHHQEGIVEIAFNGRWGMICNGGFQSVDAAAVCQGLGFGTDEASVMSVSSVRYDDCYPTDFCSYPCLFCSESVLVYRVRVISGPSG